MNTGPDEIIFMNVCAQRMRSVLAWLGYDLRSSDGAPKGVLDLLFCPDKDPATLVEEVNATFDAWPHPRSSLLLGRAQLDAIDYPLLRRVQDKNWKLCIYLDCDGLAAGLREESKAAPSMLRQVTELARKFRVEHDFLLTLPVHYCDPSDAHRLMEFFFAMNTEAVSFGRQLLLAELGIRSSEAVLAASVTPFLRTLMDRWSSHRSAIFFEDIHQVAILLENRREGQDGRKRSVFVSADAVYLGVQGSVPGCEMPLDKPALLRSAGDSACRGTCEYYAVCGGAYLGERYLYNRSVMSSLNPYCSSVVIPAIDRILGSALHE